jgi:Ca-activated chloride channel family protein
MLCSSAIFAQNKTPNSGSLEFKIIDAVTKKPIEFAIIIIQSTTYKKSQPSDKNGEVKFDSLTAGKYEAMISFVGYRKLMLTDISINAGKITSRTIALESNTATQLHALMIRDKVQLIDKDDPTQNSFRKIQNNPKQNLNSIAGVSRGIDSRNGNSVNIRGSRSDNTAYYIDGFRVSNTNETNSEQYQKVAENSFKITAQEPLSTFSIDVDKASYANIRRYLNDNSLPPKDAVRVEEMINYFNYDIALEKSIHPFVLKTEMSNSPWDVNKKLVHITLKAHEINLSEAPQNNLTFLIDVSGSMNSNDKLPLLIESMKLLIEKMRPEDKISIVVYAGAAGLVLSPTSGKDKAKIYNALDKLEAGGSTAGGQGIELAYKIAKENFIAKGNNRIILATDGDFNVGIYNINDLTKLIEQKRETGIYLSVLGFGTGNINDVTMETLADKGNGNYNYIDGVLEGKKVLVSELGGTLYTVAKDVKIQIEFNPKYVKLYKLIGYENRMLATEDFNNDKKDAGELGAGHCVTAIYEIITNASATSSIDSLKYQQTSLTTLANGDEMMNLKVRYKKLNDTNSIKFEMPVKYNAQPFELASNEMKFAVSVALFGMKLRTSESVNKVTYNEIIKIGKAAKGSDDNGYRAEFIKLVETAQLLAKRGSE